MVNEIKQSITEDKKHIAVIDEFILGARKYFSAEIVESLEQVSLLAKYGVNIREVLVGALDTPTKEITIISI